MRHVRSGSDRKSFLAAILIALLAFAPVFSANATAAHSDHMTGLSVMGVGHVTDDAHHAECCGDGQSADHSRHPGCDSCILPCMTALQALVPASDPVSHSVAVTHSVRAAQIAGGRATSPDLRPPKTRS